MKQTLKLLKRHQSADLNILGKGVHIMHMHF